MLGPSVDQFCLTIDQFCLRAKHREDGTEHREVDQSQGTVRSTTEMKLQKGLVRSADKRPQHRQRHTTF